MARDTHPSTDGVSSLELSAQDIAQIADELVVYHGELSDAFYRKEQRVLSLKYLQGLLLPSAGKKTAEGVALTVAQDKVRSVQHFLGDGSWDDRAILDRHAVLVADSIGDHDGVLIVDGSDFPKRGAFSAGVARQYCGNTGKVDNCQAGVFVGYASVHGYTLLDARLYLPEEWFAPSSRGRWERAGIPDDTPFKTKLQLAWEIIEHQHDLGAIPFAWVTCDDAFGSSHEFLGNLEEIGRKYLADVPISTLVWVERPETCIGPAKATGRPPSRPKLAPDAPAPIRVDDLAAQLPASAWTEYEVKPGEKGPIRALFAFVRAVAARDGLPAPDVWVVFRRSLSDPSELKIFLSNAPADTPHAELVRVSGMRWPIETCFEEAKGRLGMDQYQTRAWRGWHHHMTLVMLAHHFLVRVKLRLKKGLRP